MFVKRDALEYAGFQVSIEKPQKPQIRLYFFRGPQKIFENPLNPK